MLTEAEQAYLAALKERRQKLWDLQFATSYRPNRELQPHQIPPEGDWKGWVMRAGRGAGKTFAGSDWLNDQCVRTAGLRCRVIAPTYGDAVASFVEGVDGLLEASNHSAKFMPSAPGGSCIVYPNGSTVWLLGTNSPRDVDRLRALTNIDCLTGDVLVTTARGQVRMDEMQMGDRVLTRRGWRTVTRAWKKGSRSDLYELTTEAGVLTATPDHRVWVEDSGWTELRFLKEDDMILSCLSTLSSMESGSTQNEALPTVGLQREICCMSQCGNTPTDERFQKDTTSIISTMTTTTTILPICCSWNGRNTTATTCSCEQNISPYCTQQVEHGGRSMRVGTTLARIVEKSSTIVHRVVSNAAHRVKTRTSRIGTDQRTRRTGLTQSVPSAPSRSERSGTGKTVACLTNTFSLVPVRVLRNSPTKLDEPTPVYDLTVEGEHEFFANGVLVHNCDIFEEAFANPRFQEAYDQASLSRRRGQRRFVVTSTPRPHEIWKKWEEDPVVVITTAITSDNKRNDPEWVAEQESKYKGTRLYRQEFLGEVLEDVEGALWLLSDIERSKNISWEEVTAPGFLVKTVIGVDPPSGPGTCGIVVVGADRQGHIYVLEDLSVTDVLPNEWASVVVEAARRWNALVVAEINQGGRMVTETLRAADKSVPVTTVNAAQGKRTRAEPISLLWEAELQSAHIVEESPGDLAKLIDQLIGWVPPGEGRIAMASPDRLDGMVWAATYLRGKTGFTGSISVPKGTVGRRALTSTRTLR